jgi:Na+:H+ antiporter, NhaA family
MSIFITLLAFEDPAIVQPSKIAILAASLLAGVLGFGAIRFTLRKKVAQ